MQSPVEAPTPSALADLVARCRQIDRFRIQLVAAEESRVAALSAAILSMRGLLNLAEIPADKLPSRQGRITHWALTGDDLADLATPSIRNFHGGLAIDEHEQVKILSDRTWRGVWRAVTLWRDGVHGLSSRDVMEYLVRLVGRAQDEAPSAASILLERSEAVAATFSALPRGPRSRDD